MKIQPYPEFAAHSIEQLKIIQEQLHENYNVNSYENWFYDQATGLFTFSTGAEEINFHYVEVGTYSPKSNTWMWAWNNKSIAEKARNISLLVKKYGEDNNYEKLIAGLVESDEYEAWEYASIALRLFGGIGVYRPEYEDGLLKFVVLQKFVDKEIAASIKDKYIKCAAHGSGRIAFVCRHFLTDAVNLGFEEAFDTHQGMELQDDDDFQAWCNECEAVRKKVGGWDDASMKFADIKLVCEDCYFSFKKLHNIKTSMG